MGSAYSRLESVGEGDQEDSDASRSSAERSSEGRDDAAKRAVNVSVSGEGRRTVSDTAIKRGVGVWMG